MKKVLLIATVLISSLAFAQYTVPPTFWGVEFNHANDVYPAPNYQYPPTFNHIRLNDTNTGWGDIQGNNHTLGCNPGRQLYFTHLDNYLKYYTAQNNFDVTYVAAKTPCYIAANPSDTTCAYFTGACTPPTDIACSGNGPGATGGTDATFKDYLKQLWTHMMKQSYYPGRQWYFELWNEPNVGKFWNNDWINGTYCGGDQTATRRILIRMAADARTVISAIDPNVQFITPAVSVAIDNMLPKGWMWTYLELGGGQYADIIGVHSYIVWPGPKWILPVPEDVCCGKGTLIYNSLAAMAQFGQSGKPLWATEGSCGKYCSSLKDEVGWTGVFYTLMLSRGEVARFNWFCYDIFGTLWDGTQLTPTGKAVGIMQKEWGYDGGTFSGCYATKQPSCDGAGNVRTCAIIEGGTGTSGQVAWYDRKGKKCAYTPKGTGWIDYKDLSGNTTNYTGGAITLTNSPILLEKQ
jgi:hypothetical protein